MKQVLRVSYFIGILLASCSFPARADWGLFGIAAFCDKGGDHFELTAVIDASDPKSEVKAPPEFERIPYGTHELRCHVGPTIVQAALRVYGPRPTGMCQGDGYIAIDRLTIGPYKFIGHATAFNWSCDPADKSLQRILIYSKNAKMYAKSCFWPAVNSAVEGCSVTEIPSVVRGKD